MGSINWVDWSIWLVYLLFLGAVVFLVQLSSKKSYSKFLIRGFILKVLGGLSFALIYVYYYKFGDTFLYFRGASILGDSLFSDFYAFTKLLFSEGSQLPPELYEYSNSIQYSNASEEWFMIKLLTPLTILSFHSYLVTTLLISTLSFIGSWKLFEVLRDIIPRYEKLAFCASFLIPSTLFWGGGIMKDTFTLTAINLLIYFLYFSIFKRKWNWWHALWISVSFVVIFWMKAYIILAFIPAFLLGVNSLFNERFKGSFLRYIIGVPLIAGVVGVLIILPGVLSQYSDKYQVEQLQSRVRGFHTWHSDLGGSSYSLGDVEYTVTGVLTKIPSALNVTFFRPYLWESSSFVVAVAALESFLLLVVFLWAAIRLRMMLFKLLVNSPFILMLTVYCLIFGFVVGFTSYNFGALGRYKIPIFSLFTFLIFYLNIKGESSWVKRFRERN